MRKIIDMDDSGELTFVFTSKLFVTFSIIHLWMMSQKKNSMVCHLLYLFNLIHQICLIFHTLVSLAFKRLDFILRHTLEISQREYKKRWILFWQREQQAFDGLKFSNIVYYRNKIILALNISYYNASNKRLVDCLLN